jgi:hypothetical protein
VAQTHIAGQKQKEKRQFTRYRKKINLKSGKFLKKNHSSVTKIAGTSAMLI